MAGDSLVIETRRNGTRTSDGRRNWIRVPFRHHHESLILFHFLQNWTRKKSILLYPLIAAMLTLNLFRFSNNILIEMIDFWLLDLNYFDRIFSYLWLYQLTINDRVSFPDFYRADFHFFFEIIWDLIILLPIVWPTWTFSNAICYLWSSLYRIILAGYFSQTFTPHLFSVSLPFSSHGSTYWNPYFSSLT